MATSSQPSAPVPAIERTVNPADVPSGIDGPFFQELGERKRQNRDAKILLTAADGQTGVGKSNASDFLGYVCDTSAQGFTEEKITIHPQEFLEMYDTLPPGSATVMEEGEQFDARRGMTNENVDATQKWQMARVREIVAIVNLPSPQEIDSRFERLCDYWMNVERRGKLRIYKKKIHPIKRSIYYKTMQTLEWPNMDKSATFQAMDDMKHDLLDDESRDDNWVRESEVQERVAKAEKELRRDLRNEWITTLKNELGLSGSDIASLSTVDVKRARVNQIANEA